MQPLPGVKEDVETFSAIAERADEHRDGLRRVDAEHPPRVSAGSIIDRAELTGIDAVVNDLQTVGRDAVMPAHIVGGARAVADDRRSVPHRRRLVSEILPPSRGSGDASAQ